MIVYVDSGSKNSHLSMTDKLSEYKNGFKEYSYPNA